MYSLAEDLSVLTGVAKSNIETLVNRAVSIIGHDVAESLCNKEFVTEVDIGIGTLVISIQQDQIMYRFVPTKKLEGIVNNVYKTGTSPILLEVDDTLGRRIANTYKDLF